jgi:hypothetical protein
MTLPKGYKKNTPSRDYDNAEDRSTARPIKKKSGTRAVFFFILFLISLALLVNAIINTMEAGKAVDDQKKVVAQAKIAYEEAFRDIYGRDPIYPSEYPNNTPP